MTVAVAIVSGGLDSTVLAYHLNAQGYDLELVSVDYGQRHRRELESASTVADLLGAGHTVLDLSFLAHHLSGSALTDPSVEVPEGHYADESMRATVVPNRNMILLALAGGIAVAKGAVVVATGVHAGDHPVYPDCRPEFIDAMDRAMHAGNTPAPVVSAPFVSIDKTEVVRYGAKLGVPFGVTWSCYQGGDVHCGRCGTCVERREAFTLAGIYDPTTYADLGGD